MTTPIGLPAVLGGRPVPILVEPSSAPSPSEEVPSYPGQLANARPTGKSSYEPGTAAALEMAAAPPGASFHPAIDPLPGVVPVSAKPPSIHLPTNFEIRDSSDGERAEITVKAGSRTLGHLTGNSDALIYASPDGRVEAMAERIPSRIGAGRDFLVRDAEGGVVGTLRGSWNNRYRLLDAHGNEVAHLLPKVGRNNFVLRSNGRDVVLISHPSVREPGGQWTVSQETAHKIDPRLLVILPAITLLKNHEVKTRDQGENLDNGSTLQLPSE